MSLVIEEAVAQITAADHPRVQVIGLSEAELAGIPAEKGDGLIVAWPTPGLSLVMDVEDAERWTCELLAAVRSAVAEARKAYTT